MRSKGQKGKKHTVASKEELRPAKTRQMDDTFVKNEMLAEQFIDEIRAAIDHLNTGKRDLCLVTLNEIESKMQATLAWGEAFDSETGPVNFH